MVEFDITTNKYSDNFTTTFWQDFSIADGTFLLYKWIEPNSNYKSEKLQAIKETFEVAFNEWKYDYRYLTDLVMRLNHKIWQWYDYDNEIATLYNDLWEQADQFACENLTDEQASYFFRITD